MASETKKEFFDDEQKSVKSEITWVDGKREGPAKTYHPNGQVKQEASFINDHKEGPYKEFYEDGKTKIETSYRRGFLNGLYKEFHPNGNLKLETYYYAPAQLKEEGQLFKEYKANIITFVEKEFHEDGQTILRISAMAFYRTVSDANPNMPVFGASRVRHGLTTLHNQAGEKTEEEIYFNDRLHGHDYLFKQNPPQASQLITDQGKVAVLDTSKAMP